MSQGAESLELAGTNRDCLVHGRSLELNQGNGRSFGQNVGGVKANAPRNVGLGPCCYIPD